MKLHRCIGWGCNDLSSDYRRGPLTTLPGSKVSSSNSLSPARGNPRGVGEAIDRFMFPKDNPGQISFFLKSFQWFPTIKKFKLHFHIYEVLTCGRINSLHLTR